MIIKLLLASVNVHLLLEDGFDSASARQKGLKLSHDTGAARWQDSGFVHMDRWHWSGFALQNKDHHWRSKNSWRYVLIYQKFKVALLWVLLSSVYNNSHGKGNSEFSRYPLHKSISIEFQYPLWLVWFLLLALTSLVLYVFSSFSMLQQLCRSWCNLLVLL